jgi:hypothetical protein
MHSSRARAAGGPARIPLDEELQLLDQILKAGSDAGLTQAEVAGIGTTQSAVARRESSLGKHSLTIETLLQRWLQSTGALVKEPSATYRAARTRAKSKRA